MDAQKKEEIFWEKTPLTVMRLENNAQNVAELK